MRCLVIFGWVVLLFSCNNQPECLYSPTPIFNAEWEKVSNYSFEKNGQKATEKITLPDGTRLELYQNICNNTSQTYHFIVGQNLKDQSDGFWVKMAAQKFYELAEIDRSVVPIAAWAQVIEERFPEFRLGESVQIDQNKTIMIDKLVGTNDSEVVITIAQIIE